MLLHWWAKRKPQTPRLKAEIFFSKFTEVIFFWCLPLFPITGQKDKWYIINVVFLLKWLFITGWLAAGPFSQCLAVVVVVFYIFILIIWKWLPEFGCTFHYFCIIREHFFPDLYDRSSHASQDSFSMDIAFYSSDCPGRAFLLSICLAEDVFLTGPLAWSWFPCAFVSRCIHYQEPLKCNWV